MQLKQLTRHVDEIRSERDQLDGFLQAEEGRLSDVNVTLEVLDQRVGEMEGVVRRKEVELDELEKHCRCKLRDLKEMDVELDAKVNEIMRTEGRLSDLEVMLKDLGREVTEVE